MNIKSIILGIFFLVAGCGFHLRGAVDLPPWLNNVAILTENDNRDLDPLLRERLQAYNIDINPIPTFAKYRLIIQNAIFQQQITSVSSSTTPRQYQLIYTVLFKLLDAKGKELIPSSSVVITQQITINSDRILGSDEEEAIIKGEMRRDAIIQILNRLGQKA